ncbi:unnamed protein product, partial [Polarella glacialis]
MEYKNKTIHCEMDFAKCGDCSEENVFHDFDLHDERVMDVSSLARPVFSDSSAFLGGSVIRHDEAPTELERYLPTHCV